MQIYTYFVATKTSLVYNLPCLLKLTPTNLGWPASFFSSPYPLCMGVNFRFHPGSFSGFEPQNKCTTTLYNNAGESNKHSLSKRRQAQKNAYCLIPFLYKSKMGELIPGITFAEPVPRRRPEVGFRSLSNVLLVWILVWILMKCICSPCKMPLWICVFSSCMLYIIKSSKN